MTTERIASFCAAIGDHNPLYVDPEAAKAGPYGEIVAPPAFVASLRYADNVFDQLPRFGRGGLLSGIDFEFEAPIRVGDSIRVSSEVKQIYEKTGRSGTMTFVVVRSTLINQKGDVIARVDHHIMNRPRPRRAPHHGGQSHNLGLAKLSKLAGTPRQGVHRSRYVHSFNVHLA